MEVCDSIGRPVAQTTWADIEKENYAGKRAK